MRYADLILNNSEAAQDVVEAVFLSLAYVKAPPPEDRVAEWLFRECRKRALDYLRKSAGQPIEPGRELLRFASRFPAVFNEVAGKVSRLAPRSQELLWLKYGEGMNYRQIAHVVDLSISNVGFLLYEATLSLRESHGG